MNLKILNFQSIKDLDLDINGFIVIKGKSNSGKSSIRRAINSLFFNNWDKAFIRNGTKKTELMFEHNNDSIKLTKPNNSYEVNGNVFPKIGITIPDEVIELGIKFFETEAESINLIAPSQLDPLFMIAYSDQINTRILNKIFNVQKYRLASSKAKKDNDDNTRDMKTLKADISDNKAENSLEQSLLEKALEIKELMNMTDSIDALSVLTSEIIVCETSINILENILENINKLILLYTNINLLNEIKTVSLKINKTELQQDIVEDSLSVCNINIVVNEIKSLSNIEKLLSNNMDKGRILNQIEEIIKKTVSVDHILNHLAYLDKVKNIIDAISNIKTLITITRDIRDTEIKIKDISDFIVSINSVNLIDIKLTAINNEMLELQSKIKLVPVCKCCGQIINHP